MLLYIVFAFRYPRQCNFQAGVLEVLMIWINAAGVLVLVNVNLPVPFVLSFADRSRVGRHEDSGDYNAPAPRSQAVLIATALASTVDRITPERIRSLHAG